MVLVVNRLPVVNLLVANFTESNSLQLNSISSEQSKNIGNRLNATESVVLTDSRLQLMVMLQLSDIF